MYRLRRLFSAGGMVRPLLRLADGPDGAGGGSVARVRASAGFKALRRGGPTAAGRHVGSGDRGPGGMGYGQELASALAGPLANLLAAAILGRMRCTTAAGANGVLCAFNLLPVRRWTADGRCISCWRGWPVPERRNGAAGGWAFPRRWQRRPGRRGWCGARGEASGCSLP